MPQDGESTIKMTGVQPADAAGRAASEAFMAERGARARAYMLQTLGVLSPPPGGDEHGAGEASTPAHIHAILTCAHALRIPGVRIEMRDRRARCRACECLRSPASIRSRVHEHKAYL